MARKKKTKIDDETLTFLHIANIGMCIGEILGQYRSHWMKPEMQKIYLRMRKDANQLEILAEKAANVEYEN